MSIATILETFETHIKEYESAISNSLANHNGLLGGVAALQRTLSVIKPLIETFVPSSAPMIEVMDAVASDIEVLASPAEETAAS